MFEVHNDNGSRILKYNLRLLLGFKGEIVRRRLGKVAHNVFDWGVLRSRRGLKRPPRVRTSMSGNI